MPAMIFRSDVFSRLRFELNFAIRDDLTCQSRQKSHRNRGRTRWKNLSVAVLVAEQQEKTRRAAEGAAGPFGEFQVRCYLSSPPQVMLELGIMSWVLVPGEN
ncbi:hypothetical protein GWI33_014292 [Rhynchophorus ferrugineus]|uniref:Uncharacterized protein n=1 Tax=Rhynchophorus ferrugineus TaxID=354439 RepID=A0A834I2W2_RHYFE|nr:hypothetical protein GWI33_014292 [Rhynchophorus ferrugineus]